MLNRISMVLIVALVGCDSRSSSYPLATTPREALEASFQALRDNDQEAFFAYSSPTGMSRHSEKLVFQALRNVHDFQRTFDEKFGADRWEELLETRGHEGGKIGISRLPSQFDWFDESAVEISPGEVHVTLPGERDETILRKKNEQAGWTVDLLKASNQHPDVDMNETAEVMSLMLSTLPEATEAMNNGETDFAKIVDLCAKGFKKIFSFQASSSD